MADELTTRILLFSMIINIVFPVFAYSFTTIIGEQPGSSDISINEEDLINAGILFDRAESLNLTYGSYVEFNITDRLLRISWTDRLLIGDSFRFYRPSLPEQYIGDQTGNYFSANGETLRIESEGLSYFNDFYNSTMVLNFNTTGANWTRVYLPQAGAICLFKTYPADLNNITKAVYESGNLTVTAGVKFTETDSFDFRAYVNWYMGMLFTNKNYGLPDGVNWIMRIFTAVTLFAAISIAREFLPF